jgi:putative glutamine amidotransferase
LGRPRILITPWRRELETAVGPKTDLLTLAPEYADAVRRAGGLPIVTPHLDADELDEMLDLVDAVIIGGGHDMDPARYGQENTDTRSWRDESDGFDLLLTERAAARGLPILGVCRGLQVINVAMGGDLRQEVQAKGDADHPTYAEMTDSIRHRHVVEIDPNSRLARIYDPGPRSVNSLHHQAAGRLAEGLRTVAVTADGTIEAVECIDADIVAVQWHPEMLVEEDGDALFADLVTRAHARATMTA